MSFAPKSRTGFTLVEILVTLALIATLMATAIPVAQAVKDRAALARARAELALIVQALEGYRRAYGDYPQTGDFPQASAKTDESLSTQQAQSKLFNALSGVFGPTSFAASDRLPDGPRFIETAKLTVETLSPSASEAEGRQARPEACAALLDPWGRRYLYYYKRASAAAAWAVPGYWLYSAGPDGRHQAPDPASGAVPAGWRGGVNADNVWGGEPR